MINLTKLQKEVIKIILYLSILLYLGLNYVHYQNELLIMELKYQTEFMYQMSIYEYHKILWNATQYLVFFIGTLVLLMTEKFKEIEKFILIKLNN